MENFLICKQDYFDGRSRMYFRRGYPYQVLSEHAMSGGTVLEVQDQYGKTAFLGQETVRDFFFENAPGSLYGVRRYIDELAYGECGIDASSYLTGVFSSLVAAVETWKALRQEKGGGETYYLFVFLPNHTYGRGEEPYLGGASYVE